MNKYPKVSIILINWNGIKDTLECLDSLKNVDYQNKYIIVVDNGSDNNEGDLIKSKYPNIHLIKNKHNQGFTGGCNMGIRHAFKTRSDYILLLNNDTIVTKNFLKPLVDLMESKSNIGLVSPIILYNRSDRVWYGGGFISYVTGFTIHNGKNELIRNFLVHNNHPMESPFITGCCMLIRKSLIEKKKQLDQDYFAYYEDADLSFRSMKEGFTNFVTPLSTIYHKKSASSGIKGSNKLKNLQAYYMARNAFIFSKKNLTGIKKYLYFFSQFYSRLPYNLILCADNRSRFLYMKGVIDGLLY